MKQSLAALAAAALLVAGCAVPTTIYTETESEIRLNYGGGGLLKTKLRIYAEIYGQCRVKRCVIDGPMISADAFYAFGIPGVCYTTRAVWSPHAVSAGGLYRLPGETDNIARYLPAPLQRHFRASFWYYDFITARDIGYNELLRIWPGGACDHHAAVN